MIEDLDRVLQTRAGRRVEYLSITWTSLEAIIGVTVGILAGSVALIGFGADSIIEVASSCVLLWWLAEGSIDRDRAAHRLVGACFFALAAYIAIDASADLLKHEAPRVTYFGIIYAGACIVVMPLLARAKRRVAMRLNSNALHADSSERYLRLSLGDITSRSRAQRRFWLVVGRSNCGSCHADNHHPRRHRRLVWQNLFARSFLRWSRLLSGPSRATVTAHAGSTNHRYHRRRISSGCA